MPARPSAPDSGRSTPILITLGAVPEAQPAVAATRTMRPAIARARAILDDTARLCCTAAKSAYEAALKLNPMNSIAKKNAARINTLLHQKEGLKVGGTRVDLNLFVEEMGKTIITNLENSASDICSKVAAGDVAELKIEGDGVAAETSRGMRLGLLEAKLARRLIKFMRGGNRYQAGVTSCDGNTVKLIVRETYQDPHFAGKPSFPMRRKREVEFRPYAKESLLARDSKVFAGEEEEEGTLAEAPG